MRKQRATSKALGGGWRGDHPGQVKAGQGRAARMGQQSKNRRGNPDRGQDRCDTQVLRVLADHVI